MAKVIGVRFRDNGKIYYFSSEQFEVEVGQNVIVETARGVEYGRVCSKASETSSCSGTYL